MFCPGWRVARRGTACRTIGTSAAGLVLLKMPLPVFSTFFWKALVPMSSCNFSNSSMLSRNTEYLKIHTLLVLPTVLVILLEFTFTVTLITFTATVILVHCCCSAVRVAAFEALILGTHVDSYLLSHPKHNSHPALRRKIWIASALAWILAAAAGIAAIFFTEILGRDCCFLRPFLSFSNFLIKLIELLITFLVPLIVTWVFVGVALRRCPHSFPSEAAKVGENGPNRSLMLGLASAFTVTYIIYWIFDMTFFFTYIGDLKMVITLYYVKVALPTICETLSPILVIYLTEDLRQKVAGWVSSRGHSTSLPLAEL
ncbi:hypothetical protein E2C01_007526 [Portunus trituberculatus]|uniref:G-protein coupled receptors family 1 profile domain-containing protein n=1 Tax=Portunus trituberculatus TaxID=210409 RepID=A0A5B7CYE4_PORTR|nr:hypothetical protein [Portunus trituberculatus]